MIAALRGDESADAAIAAAPVTDTIKRVDADGAVSETLDRVELWAVQTPQVFRRAALERALDVPAEVLAQATDDAWLIERAGGRVIVVAASAENLKVTTAARPASWPSCCSRGALRSPDRHRALESA